MAFPARTPIVSIMRTLLLSALLAASAAAQEWTQFRGPNGTGISPAKGLPETWTEKDFVWRVPVPGQSHSQPVIWGEKIFQTTASTDGTERSLVCLSKKDGQTLWSKKVPLSTHKKHNFNSFSSGSPVVDKDRVVACFVSTDQYLVKAFDHAGKELWTRNLGAFNSQHGHGSSPILYDGKIIVTNDQDGKSFVAALDTKTGTPVWQSARREMKQGTAYATPVVLQREGARPELLLASQSHGLSSLDPKTGAANWEATVFGKRVVATPVVAGDLVIGTCGQGENGASNTLAAVRLGGKGDVTTSHVAYTIDKGAPYVPTPLVVGDRLYLVSDPGVASAYEVATGKQLWMERLGGSYFASPVYADGKIYLVAKDGQCAVLAAGDTYKLIGKSPLGEASYGTPCIDGNRIYFKTFGHLVCVGGK